MIPPGPELALPDLRAFAYVPLLCLQAIALHPRWDGTSATLVRRALALPIVLLAWRAPLEFRLAPEQSVPLNFPYGCARLCSSYEPS